jgi:hypothetical protein
MAQRIHTDKTMFYPRRRNKIFVGKRLFPVKEQFSNLLWRALISIRIH